MTCIRSFPPIATPAARILILGSMPGQASLDADKYYAHPQNAFWPIMGELMGTDPDLSYRSRVAALKVAGIALWDVLSSCEREGSLDVDIQKGSIVANDFISFFAAHQKITDVFFNGTMAETSFRRHVLPLIGHTSLHYARLPSTSPAHASLSRIRKLGLWRKAFESRGIITAIR